MNTEQQILTIKQKADRIDDFQLQRLPRRKQTLLSQLCGWRWMLQTIRRDAASEDLLKNLKQMKLELNQMWYRVAEQGEIMTKLLCELDNIFSDGDDQVRKARKEQVCRLQTMLDYNDNLKQVCDKIKTIGHKWLTPVIENIESQLLAEEQPEVENSPRHISAEQTMESESASEENMKNEESSDIEEEEVDEASAMAIAEMEEAMASDEEEPTETPEIPMPKLDLRRLPVWNPQHRVSEEHDGVHLKVNLRNVDDENFAVNYSEDGVLQISGYKLPTQDDIQVAKWTGRPTFGRFIIEKQFPIRALVLENATMNRLRSGVLDICIPYRPVRRQQYRSSPWHPSQFSGVPIQWF